jgi:sulfate adenylyltransferase
LSHTPAHGGSLRTLLATPEKAEELKGTAADLPALALSLRQLCDVELLLNGGFSPLPGFMDEETYESVVERSRLADGLVWPIPVVLDVSASTAERMRNFGSVALHDPEGFALALLHVESVWKPDKRREAELVYGTTSPLHPGVRALYETGDYYVGGTLQGIQHPTHHDYEDLRHEPEELRHLFGKMGWRRIVAFHTVKPIHRLQREITLRAAKAAQAHILLHPAVGITKPGDFSYHSRARCYRAVGKYYPHGLVMLSLLPLAMRMAGPREALWHAIIRQNFGCSHFVVGYEHASPRPSNGQGSAETFYAPYAAQELLASFQDELRIQMVPIKEICYAPRVQRFVVRERLGRIGDEHCIGLSTQQLAEHFAHGKEIPGWFSFPEVIEELRKLYPPRNQRGITLFFTGLSGSGKSTLAKILYGRLIEQGGRPVTLLDGDIVRRNLSSELGFSKEHRDLNIRRIGFVASEITKNRGIAICAPIAPYVATRRAVREMVEQDGAFIEIFVSTPLEVCEERDRKGLYAKARKGIIKEFTGVSDPYEEPEAPEVRIDTANLTPLEAAEEIFLYLLREGYLDTNPDDELSAGLG